MALNTSGEMTVDRVLRYNGDRFADDAAIQFQSRGVTYGELDSMVSRFARGLLARGLSPGQNVLVLLPNSIEHAVIMFGIQRAGATYVGCSTLFTPDEIAYELLHSDAVAVVTTPDRVHLLSEVAAQAGRAIVTLTVGDAEGSTGDDFADIMLSEDASRSLQMVKADQPAIIFYTSGTTSRPKGVVWSHGAYFTSARRHRDTFDYARGERTLHFWPMYYSYGGSCILTPTMLVAGTVFLQEKFSASGFIPTVIANDITMTGISATHTKFILARPESAFDNAHSLRRAQFALTLDLERRLEFTRRFGIQLVGFYGITEGVGMVCSTTPWAGSVQTAEGTPMPELEARIADADGNEVRQGSMGEVLLRSPKADALCSGYFKDEAATQSLFRDGWMHTGDLGYFDADGFFHYVDRLKDMIKHSGHNVAAPEVERVLVEHPDISEAAVVGVPDEEREEAIVAFIVCHGRKVELDELQRHCEARLAVYKRPSYVIHVAELPENFVGKVVKRELRAMAIEQLGRDTYVPS